MSLLLAVDGNSLFHRAYHGVHPNNKNVKDNWAVTGFLNILTAVVEKVNPSHLIIGFDDVNSSRKRIYPPYKSTRKETDVELKTQLKTTVKFLKDAGFNVVIPELLEADDVLASSQTLAKSKNWDLVVATSDRDSFSLIDDSTKVLRLVNGGVSEAVLVDDEILYQKYGVYGYQYLDYAAIRGDKSDNLPGIKSFGEKTAVKLLQSLKSMQLAFEDLEKGSGEVEKAIGLNASKKLALSESKSDFKTTRALMLLHDEINLEPFTKELKFEKEALKTVTLKHKVNVSNKFFTVFCPEDSDASSGSFVEASYIPGLHSSNISDNAPDHIDIKTHESISSETLVSTSDALAPDTLTSKVDVGYVFHVQNDKPVKSLLTMRRK